MEKTAAFNIYKKSAAAQVSLIRPTFNEKGYVDRTGSVLIEAAVPAGENANGDTVYNWAQGEKITISLGMNDLCLLFDDITKSLVHDYKGKLKTLQFQAGSGKYEGTYMLHLREKDATAGTEKKVTVPVSAGEMRAFGKLLDAAVPKILGW